MASSRAPIAGAPWTAVNTGLSFATSPVFALAINPTTPSTLYAGTLGSGVYHSTNSGGSWTAVNTGLSDLCVQSLAINPTTPNTLYTGTYGSGVFESTNSGGNWTAVNTGLSDLFVNALVIDPTAPSRLFATTPVGVFSIQQVAGCAGDCNANGEVTIDGLLTLVNIALGTTQPSACPSGIPRGADVNIVLILQAVNNALNGCGGG